MTKANLCEPNAFIVVIHYVKLVFICLHLPRSWQVFRDRSPAFCNRRKHDFEVFSSRYARVDITKDVIFATHYLVHFFNFWSIL